MKLYLKKLSLNDGEKELEYLRSIPENENGFYNPASPEDLVDNKSFEKWLMQRNLESQGKNLIDGYVPQTIYWIMNENNNIIGIGKLRHYLNEYLLTDGGHIGIGISSKYREKGIGTLSLKLLLEEAKKLNIQEVLLTNDENNIASRRIVEKCGGILENINNGKCKYWIKTKKM